MTINHIAFIMDGNRRWARKRGLHPFKGHEAGVEAFRRIGKFCQKQGIKYMTVYALSVENIIKRNPMEIAFHFKLHKTLFKKEVLDTDRFMKDGIKLNVFGRLEMLPKSEQKLIRECMEKTKNNKNHILNVCIAYNGQDEIVDAVRQIIEKGIKPEKINRETIKQHLYTKDIPPPDLIVRTGMNPDQRLSGFLLWDSSYAEFAFTKTLWPDFNEQELSKMLEEFSKRKRREGK